MVSWINRFIEKDLIQKIWDYTTFMIYQVFFVCVCAWIFLQFTFIITTRVARIFSKLFICVCIRVCVCVCVWGGGGGG